jgi:hypothetical protein
MTSGIPCGPVVALFCLLLGHPLVHLHDELGRLRLDEDGDGVEPGRLVEILEKLFSSLRFSLASL